MVFVIFLGQENVVFVLYKLQDRDDRRLFFCHSVVIFLGQVNVVFLLVEILKLIDIVFLYLSILLYSWSS